MRGVRRGSGGVRLFVVAGCVVFFSGWWLPRNRNYGVGEEKRERKRRAGAAVSGRGSEGKGRGGYASFVLRFRSFVGERRGRERREGAGEDGDGGSVAGDDVVLPEEKRRGEKRGG
ncbi:hypothetical protein HAX54_029464 [Datura stramonium]|uniref:Uncharacterized protein n=1 Tax=Datura stramonium TaxID=4076 RepID=A0ABS8V787_DATST|nr:hypothetical protein [Datura stramonium]